VGVAVVVFLLLGLFILQYSGLHEE
jgi:hypothetical protein